MKRKLFVSDHIRSKFPRLVKPLEPKRRYFWVSATHTKNYLKRDPLVDWLKITQEVDEEKNLFQNYAMQKGNDFENSVIKYINKNVHEVKHISEKINSSSCKKTIEYMKEGVPIIHSAPVRDKESKTHGIIDLLVRSDYLHLLVNENPLPEKFRTIPAPNLNQQFHYVVIDIKFSTLALKADGTHLLNSDNFPAYKSQLWIYNNAIGKIQGYTPRCSYILGRRWRFTTRGEKYYGRECFDKLGVVDFQGADKEYVQKTLDAIQWVKDVKKEGKKWSISPPTRKELYPNMCVDSGKWDKMKEEIATELKDITQIWYCGLKQRENAMKEGITSWDHPECTSEKMGMRGSRAPIIDKILEINRQEEVKILPKKIESGLFEWNKECNEMFVDFETFTDIFAPLDNLPHQPKTDTIFMIGVYHKNEKGEWKYRNFTVKDTSLDEEFRIMSEFMKFVEENNYPKLWYWHAENNIWSTAEDRQFEYLWNKLDINGHSDMRLNHLCKFGNLEWADLAVLFRSVPIVIKNCFNFGLKNVAKAMFEHGFITTNLSSECTSGLMASVKAWNSYQESDNPLEHPDIIDIAKYNRFDVKVLQDILFYLRKYH